jgi:hypothetical protein
MPDNPLKIDWKLRLEAMKQAQAKEPSQSVGSSTEPPVRELFAVQEAPSRPPQPELELEPSPDPESEPEAKTDPEPEHLEHDEVQVVGFNEVFHDLAAPLPDPHAGQLEKLEAQIHSLKLMGIVAAFLAIISLIGLAYMMSRGQARSAVIHGDTLTIQDSKGISRAWLGVRDGQVCVELRDKAGERRLSLGLDTTGEPRLIFYNKDQKILTEIAPLPDGQTGIELLNQVGEPVATIPVQSPLVPDTQKPQVIAPLPKPILEPEKISQEAPKAEQKTDPNPESVAKAETSEFFVANPGGKAYHLPSCSWVKNIPLDSLLKFSSAAEAAKAGYHPCRRCRPDHKD